MKLKHINHGCLLISLISLVGCGSPQIKESYDEFTQTKICRLEPFVFNIDTGFYSSRFISISLEAMQNSNIKAVLTSRNHNSMVSSYGTFTSKSKLKFIVKNSDKTEEFVFASENISITYEPTPRGNSIPETHITFTLKSEQLDKIIKAPITEFYFEAGKDPIKGEFNSKTKEFFKHFMDKCMPLAGGRK